MTTTTTTTTTTTDSYQDAGRRARAVLAATVASLTVWVLAVPIGGLDVAATTGGTETDVGPASVALGAASSSVAGWGLLALLERLWPADRAWRWWRTIALATMALSLLSPLASATSAAAACTLMAMHLAMGTALIALLGPSTPAPRLGAGTRERP